MNKKKIVIIGATSGIGRGLAEMYAKDGNVVVAVGRRECKLKELTRIYSDQVIPKVCDIADFEAFSGAMNSVLSDIGTVDLVVLASGTGDINKELSFEIERSTIMTNVLGWTLAADWAMNLFDKQGFGQFVSISSIAGIRGGSDAPAYNATKAYQINYTEGLRVRAVKSNKKISVTDIRPGFVDTEMAKGEGIFWKAPVEKACKQIYNAIENRESVAYVTKRWGLIGFLLKHLPMCVYNKL